jgi:hypothetical protein
MRIGNRNIHKLVELEKVPATHRRPARLRLVLTPAGREHLFATSTTSELMEWHMVNGPWSVIGPKEVPGAIEGAPILSDEVQRAGDKVTKVGMVYWWPLFEHLPLVPELLECGEVELDGVPAPPRRSSRSASPSPATTKIRSDGTAVFDAFRFPCFQNEFPTYWSDSVNYSSLRSCVKSLVPVGQPVFIWGPPGVGKSTLVGEVAKTLGRMFIDIRAVLLDPVDLRGIPSIVNGTTRWNPPAFLPTEGEGVLFLDELPQSPPLVQAALLQICLERKLGEYHLPDGWAIVAAGNRSEDRAGGHRVISPLLNRFMHLDLEVDHDDWHDWARDRIAPEIRSFLKFKPALLYAFKPELNEKAFPTPRSWEFANRVFPTVPAFDAKGNVNPIHNSLIAGCVGQGAATEFTAYLETWKKMPDVDLLLSDPDKAPVPSEISILWAVSAAVAQKAKGAGQDKLESIAKYGLRLPDEFSVLMFRDALALNGKMAKAPATATFLDKHGALLRGE